MKQISTFLFAALLFASCQKDDEAKPISDPALEAVEAAVWGKTLTQEFIPDFPAVATIDDEITFTDTNGDTNTFEVDGKDGLAAPENPAYPGTCAVFEGDGYQLFVTIQDVNKYRLKAKKNGVVLMEGTFAE